MKMLTKFKKLKRRFYLFKTWEAGEKVPYEELARTNQDIDEWLKKKWGNDG